MSSCVVKMSENKTKLIISMKTSERSTSITSIIFNRNAIHLTILSLSPVDVFLRGFWRSVPSMNAFALNCISCNKKRKAKSSPRNRVQYISVSPSPQLTSSSSSSSSGATISSSVSSESNPNAITSSPKPMTLNDSSQSAPTSAPSAPSPGLVMFNSEENADIVFLVGRENEEVWRIPGHLFILESASFVFKNMVEGEATNGQPITKRINNIKAELFHTILRHIYTNEITIMSVNNALELFTAANQFFLDDLCRLCLTFLYDNCNEDNVLEMLSHFSLFSYLKPSFLSPVDVNGSPIALSTYMSKQPPIQFANNCDNILNELITRCYYTLDSAASRILASDAFCNLEHDLIVKILSRDTLNIRSEIEIFECIKRWACHQCKRQARELTGDNKRQILGKALYCPRYLTMTFDEFMRGPQMSDFLSDEEKRPLLARLAGDSQVPPLPEQLTARKLDVRRRFVEKVPKTSADVLATNTANACIGGNGSNAGIVAKKKSASKKLLNGLGDLVICVIRLLD